MSTARKRCDFNERVKIAHERKEWVEECRRIDRMEHDAHMGIARKQSKLRKLQEAKNLH